MTGLGRSISAIDSRRCLAEPHRSRIFQTRDSSSTVIYTIQLTCRLRSMIWLASNRFQGTVDHLCDLMVYLCHQVHRVDLRFAGLHRQRRPRALSTIQRIVPGAARTVALPALASQTWAMGWSTLVAARTRLTTSGRLGMVSPLRALVTDGVLGILVIAIISLLR